MIIAKELQLSILAKELERVQNVVKDKMCNSIIEKNDDKVSKSSEINGNKTTTTVSSFSTLPESAITNEPSIQVGYKKENI